MGFCRGPEAQIYSIEKSDLSLVATAEITLGGSQKDQILDTSVLPLKYAGLSHCFRTEAGVHGRATRGIYRVHQFTKVEMFGFTAPDLAESAALLTKIVSVRKACSRRRSCPIGSSIRARATSGARRTVSSIWKLGCRVRGEGGEFGEVTSASNCTDYQARRLGIRCKGSDRKGTQFVHTLNGTAVAATRAIIAILENGQQADESVLVPEVSSQMGRSGSHRPAVTIPRAGGYFPLKSQARSHVIEVRLSLRSSVNRRSKSGMWAAP